MSGPDIYLATATPSFLLMMGLNLLPPLSEGTKPKSRQSFVSFVVLVLVGLVVVGLLGSVVVFGVGVVVVPVVVGLVVDGCVLVVDGFMLMGVFGGVTVLGLVSVGLVVVGWVLTSTLVGVFVVDVVAVFVLVLVSALVTDGLVLAGAGMFVVATPLGVGVGRAVVLLLPPQPVKPRAKVLMAIANGFIFSKFMQYSRK